MAEAAEQPQSVPSSKKHSAEDFITRWPLYTPFDFPEYSAPERISFYCTQCGKETTWALAARDWNPPNSLWLVRYQCSLCQKNSLSVIYRESKHAQKSHMGPGGTQHRMVSTQVQKIGQSPALTIEIPKALETNLGKMHASLYKKALINRNEGYGLGAVGYMRRVVEDKTEELIEVVAQLAETHQIDPKIVEKIRAAKTEKTTYDQKLKIAATVLPGSLVIDGVNPLDLLYGLVSGGLHDLTEEQCVEIADEIKSVFEYTFTRLRAEIDERKDFAVKVKKWAGGNHPATKKPTS